MRFGRKKFPRTAKFRFAFLLFLPRFWCFLMSGAGAEHLSAFALYHPDSDSN